jgi:hypothetical protein
VIRVGRPARSVGKFVKADHDCHVVAFLTPRLETDVATSYGPADAARCDVVCVDYAEYYDDQLLFGKALVPALTAGDDPVVCGVFGQGRAKDGQSAPWVIDEPDDDDVARVQAVVDRCVTEAGGVLVVDVDRLAALKAETPASAAPTVTRVQRPPAARAEAPVDVAYDEEPF